MPNSVRYYRKKAGFTLKGLAEKSGLAHSTIGNVETGVSNPGPEFIQKISEVLNISAEELMAPPPIPPGNHEKISYGVRPFEHQGEAYLVREEPSESNWERRALNAEAKLDALTAAMEALLNRFKIR